MSRPPTSIVWRTLVANAAVFAIAFLLLVFSPVTISAPIRLAELGVLTAGTLAILAVNWILVRRALEPLRRLSEQMERTDLTNGPVVEPSRGAEVREVEIVTRAFAAMVERLAEERRQTSRAVLAGQEGERLRVARELHDEVGQSLIALTLQAERAAERAAPDEAHQFAEIAAKLRFNLDELRRIAHELRPEALDDLGLLNALIALANGTGVRGELTVERDLPAELPALSDEQELVVYRIAQEALSNVARHSGADRTVLWLRIAEGELHLTVDDNGRGLAAGEREGVGIGGMRERALLAGGRLRLGPRADGEAGTEVVLVLPLETAGGRRDVLGDGG